MPWAAHAWEVRKRRQEYERYWFNSFDCKARENRKDKVRAMGREDYVRMGGVGCFCAGRKEWKRKSGLTD